MYAFVKCVSICPLVEVECTPITPNFIPVSRLMMPHIHQEGMKRITTHIVSYASKIELGQKKNREKIVTM